MSQTCRLSNEQWAEVEPLILACEQESAIWRVREFTGVGPEEAVEMVRLRFHQLCSARPDDYAWNLFPCRDYLSSELADRGFWEDPSQTMLIVPAWQARVRHDLGLLAIGGPGWDGIEWGYKQEQPGLWAYYPIDSEFIWMAATVADLIEKYLSGELRV